MSAGLGPAAGWRTRPHQSTNQPTCTLTSRPVQTAAEPLKLRALANLIELLRADEETMAAAQQDTTAGADGGLPAAAGGARKKGGRKKGGAAAAEAAAADAERAAAVQTQNGVGDTLSQSSSILQARAAGGRACRRRRGCRGKRSCATLARPGAVHASLTAKPPCFATHNSPTRAPPCRRTIGRRCWHWPLTRRRPAPPPAPPARPARRAASWRRARTCGAAWWSSWSWCSGGCGAAARTDAARANSWHL